MSPGAVLVQLGRSHAIDGRIALVELARLAQQPAEYVAGMVTDIARPELLRLEGDAVIVGSADAEPEAA